MVRTNNLVKLICGFALAAIAVLCCIFLIPTAWETVSNLNSIQWSTALTMLGIVTTAKSDAVSTALTRIMRTTIRNTSSLWPMVATRVPSTSDQETYGWLGDVPGMKEFLGDRIFQELRSMNYSVRNKSWEQSVGLDMEVVDDDRHGLYVPTAQRMSQKAARNPDKLLVNLMIAGESSLCYDGQYFFDTDHSEGDSGTQSNLLTYDAVSTTAVTVAEFKAAFHQALVKMFSYKTDQGDFWIEPEAVGFEDNNLIVLVPLALWEVADAAMTQVLESGGGQHHMLRRAKVVPVIRMGSEGGGSNVKFDLIYNGDMIRPYVFQDRSPLVAQAKGINDIEDKFIKLMTYARYNVGYGLWQMAVRTTFT